MPLASGSAWYVPAGVARTISCIGEIQCEFYFHSKEKFDLKPLKRMLSSRHVAVRTVPYQALEWAEVRSFSQMATAFDDRDRGAHGTIGIFKAQTEAPPHTHSNSYPGVVIRGTMTNPFGDDTAAPTLSPGSSWFVPAGSPHRAACISEEPCMFYFSRMPSAT